MKHLRHYLTLLLVALLGTLTFIACDKDKDDDSDSSDTGANSIVGTWTRTDSYAKDITYEFIFKADKTFTYKVYYKGIQDHDNIGIYCTVENVLTIIFDTDSIKYREHTYIYSIDGNKLTLYTVAVSGVKDEDLDKEPIVLTRKK